MKIAYLISTHNNPQLLQLMLNSLHTPNSAFFIHVDRKVNIEPYYSGSVNNTCFIRDRIIVEHNSFSIVQATLMLMKEVLKQEVGYDYLELLSGSDYSLQTASYIEDFFTQHRGKEFINTVQMPATHAGKPISRLK